MALGALLALPALAGAQVFVGPSGQLIPPGAPGVTAGVTTAEVTVSGVGTLSNCSALERVFINIDHTFVGDVAIFIISPAGTALELTSGNGGFRDNWRNTTFRDDAAVNIVNGTPPYTGTFRPEGRQQNLAPPFTNAPALSTFTLANTFAGEDADGVWQLYVNDYVAIDVGQIIDWELEFVASSSTLAGELQASTNSLCQGQEVDLFVVGDVPPTATFAWSGGEDTPTITVAPTEETTYAVTVTDGACELELDITLTPDAPPTISGESTICGDDGSGSVQLTAAGGGPYTWSNGATGPSITVSPTATTSYTVNNGGGDCNTSAAFEVTVQPITLDLLASATGICAGDPVTLTAAGGSPTATYAWSTGDLTPTITFSPTASTNYSVTLTEGSCTLTEELLIIAYPTSVDLGPDRTICANELISLTATGTGPFVWSTGETAEFILVSPSVTTTYTATATQGTCSVTDEITVTVIPDASVSAGLDQTICAGEQTRLEATGTGPFSWSDGQMGASITVSPATTTTYTVTVGGGACAASDEVTVTVGEQPTVELGDDASYCADGPSTLTAQGSFDALEWNTGASTATINLQSEGTVTYSAIATIGSCMATDTVTISIFPEVSLTASPDTAICAGGQATLSASGTGPFRWSTGEVSPAITVSPSGLQTYTVTAGGGDCTVTEEVLVSINPSPTADLGADRSVCITEEITLSNASPADTYAWSTGSTEPSVSITAEVDTAVALTVTRGDCSASDTINLSVGAPVVDLGPDLTVCPGDTVRLAAPDGATYQWSDGSTAQLVTLTPTSDQTVTLEVLIDGCPARDTVQLEIAQALSLDAGKDVSICPGDSAQLRAQSAGSVNWSTGVSGAELTVTPDEATYYFATVGSGNCAVTDSVLVSLYPAANVDLGPGGAICIGSDTILAAEGNVTTFIWSTGEATPEITVAPGSDSTFQLTAATANGCAATDSLRISIIEPRIALAPTPEICPADSVTLTASGADSYVWQGGEATSSIRRAPSGTTVYRVTGFTRGCPVEGEATVVVRPRANVNAGEDRTVCPGDSVVLRASGDGPFTWNTGVTGATTLTVGPSVETTYTVRAGAGNCADSASVVVSLFPAVEAELGGDRSICSGDSILLTADTGPAEFTWADGTFPAERWVSPLGTTTYAITASANGCTAADSAQITVNELPVVELISADCTVDNVSYAINVGFSGGRPGYRLNGMPVGNRADSMGILSGVPFTVTISDANGCAATFTETVNCGCRVIELSTPTATCNGNEVGIALAQLLPVGAPAGAWSVLDAGQSGLPVIDGNTLLPSGAPAGRYTLQFTPEGASLDCLPEYRTSIEIVDPPTAGRQAVVEERCVESAGRVALFDELIGAVPGGTWSAVSPNATGNLNFDAATASFSATGQPSGDYVFRYQAPDGIDCPGDVTDVTVRLVATEVAGVFGAPNCETTCSGSITVLEPTVTNLYGLNDEPLSSAPTYTALCPGQYTLRTEDDRGCVASTPITVPETIAPALEVGGVTKINLGDSTLLEVLTNVATDSVRWSQPVNCLDTACLVAYVRPGLTTEYQVAYTSLAGCEATARVTVFVDERVEVYVPTAFSPNGDGINDRLTVYAGDNVIAVREFRIYDRWGSQVATFPEVAIGNESAGWDGTHPGSQRPQAGVYIYSLRFTRIDGTEGYAAGELIIMR